MAAPHEIEMLLGLQDCNYSAMAALMFTVYDIILGFGDEVEQIWKRPWTRLKILFYVLRSISVFSQLLSTAITLQLASGGKTSLRGCQTLVGFQGVSSQVLSVGIQLILIMRVQALYYQNTLLRKFILCFFIAEIVVVTVVFIISFPEITYGVHCVTLSFPIKAIGFFAPSVLFEFLLFVLTMKKFYEAVRDGWGREPVVSRFLKDGIWAFALPFAILLLNLCCMLFLPGARSSIVYSWMIAMPGFAGCRLILNMSHLLKANVGIRSDPTYPIFDTDLATGHSTTNRVNTANYSTRSTAIISGSSGIHDYEMTLLQQTITSHSSSTVMSPVTPSSPPV